MQKAELYPDVAPITVENFVSLIERNFFDGLISPCNSGFMIQGGGFTADGQHKANNQKGEFDGNLCTNPLKPYKRCAFNGKNNVPEQCVESVLHYARGRFFSSLVSMPLSVGYRWYRRLTK